MTILIKSAKIIDPKSAFHNKQVDILVENGTCLLYTSDAADE